MCAAEGTPADVAALLATLDVKLDAARRLRLAQDAGRPKEILDKYWREIRAGMDRMIGVREWLVAVRQLAGPSPGALKRLSELVTDAQRDFSRVQAPPEVAAAHSTLVAAAGMALRAATIRPRRCGPAAWIPPGRPRRRPRAR